MGKFTVGLGVIKWAQCFGGFKTPEKLSVQSVQKTDKPTNQRTWDIGGPPNIKANPATNNRTQGETDRG